MITKYKDNNTFHYKKEETLFINYIHIIILIMIYMCLDDCIQADDDRFRNCNIDNNHDFCNNNYHY